MSDLRKYGRHLQGCNVARALPFEVRAGKVTCTCGFSDALAFEQAEAGPLTELADDAFGPGGPPPKGWPMTKETTPMDVEVMACPFCQSKAVRSAYVRVSDDAQWHHVECTSCFAYGPHRNDEADAIADWNKCRLSTEAAIVAWLRGTDFSSRHPEDAAFARHVADAIEGGKHHG